MSEKELTFKKGDHVCFGWGNKDIFEIKLKPRLKGRIEYITIEMEGRRRECLAQSFRWALPAEVERKHRIDDFNELKSLGGSTTLIQIFGLKTIKGALETNINEFTWDKISFSRDEAIAALEAYEQESNLIEA